MNQRESMKESVKESIFVIESLRAGVPTRLSTRILPDLRQNITEKITEDLASFAHDVIPQGRILWGQYGQGKTHALTAIEHKALDMNFAVSRISLSREVSCHQLFKFYANVAPRIKTPTSTLEGIQHYLDKMNPGQLSNSRIKEENRYSNLLPTLVLEDYFLAEGEEREKLYADLVGQRVPISELGKIHRLCHKTALPKTKFKVANDTQAYFGMMADTLKLCGFNGWVILIDEVELLGRLGKASRYKAYQNLSWLLNWDNSQSYPIYVIAAAATRLQDDLWYGKTDDDRTVMPELAAKEGAAAVEKMTAFFTKAIDGRSLRVLPAEETDLAQLLDGIANLHGTANSWDAAMDSASLIRQLGYQPVRTYIRAALEYLDLQYLYQQAAIPALSTLGEVSLEHEEEYEEV